jgi:hypothetical protein
MLKLLPQKKIIKMKKKFLPFRIENKG